MLEKEVALVTGASRGIGHAIALALGTAGARVIGTSTGAEGAAKLGKDLASHGCNGRGAVLDAGSAGQANYAAAEAGLLGFSGSLARELGSRGMTVNAVAPGRIDTDMTRARGEEQRRALLEQVPMGRLGAPEEVAGAVLFLVSPQADYITGETLHVNGGMYMG